MSATSINLTRGAYKGWRTWHIRRDPLELVLLPEVGGRIVGIFWHGLDLCFTDPARQGRLENIADIADLSAKKRDMGFPLWGGDKTWLAPQTRWTESVPFIDLDSGSYRFSVEDENPANVTVSMTSPLCRETGAQITRTVTVSLERNDWTVRHRLTNGSGSDIQWGLWDVCMVHRPGVVYLPTRKDSPFDSGVKTFVEEGESKSVRKSVVQKLGSLAAIQCRGNRSFKFGVDSTEGWMLGIIEQGGRNLIGYRKELPVFKDEPYGHGCTAEVFNSAPFSYFEMEIHGPVVDLKPQQSFELEERQAMFDVSQWPATEAEVRRLI